MDLCRECGQEVTDCLCPPPSSTFMGMLRDFRTANDANATDANANEANANYRNDASAADLPGPE